MSCYGCQENLANQLGHMDIGGCLYHELGMALETPPSSPTLDFPGEVPLVDSAPEFFPEQEQENEPSPLGCAVCITQDYFSGTVRHARRASHDTMRCQGHVNQCAYCYSPDCQDTLLCERCSYSGVGNASITEAFNAYNNSTSLCLYDRDMSPSEGWDCGCSRCIEAVAAFYAQESDDDT
jgi:hypothetical protein